MVCTCTGCHPAFKGKGILTGATAGMNLEDMMLHNYSYQEAKEASHKINRVRFHFCEANPQRRSVESSPGAGGAGSGEFLCAEGRGQRGAAGRWVRLVAAQQGERSFCP